MPTISLLLFSEEVITASLKNTPFRTKPCSTKAKFYEWIFAIFSEKSEFCILGYTIRYVYHIYQNCLWLTFIVREVKLLHLLIWRQWHCICTTKAFSDLKKRFHTMKQTELEILCEDWTVQKRFLLLSGQYHGRMYITLKADTVLSKEEMFKALVCWLLLRTLNRVSLTGCLVYFYGGDHEWWPRVDIHWYQTFYIWRQFCTGCPYEENCCVNCIHSLLDGFWTSLILLPAKSLRTHQKLSWFYLAL